jgi:putative Mg2+ transporter-C (MgtC) family protein
MNADAIAIVGRLALAFVLSAAIGLERQRKARGAGFRTHILVCLTSTMTIMAAGLLTRDKGLEGFNEMSRVAQGLLTGIGFIGAGTIVTVGIEHRGLTTAAMLWFVAGMGIALGTGLVLLPVVATVFALVAAFGLEYLERALPANERIHVRLQLPQGFSRIEDVEKTLHGKKLSAVVTLFQTDHDDCDQIDIVLTLPAKKSIGEVGRMMHEIFPDSAQMKISR